MSLFRRPQPPRLRIGDDGTRRATMDPRPEFLTALLGYDRAQVDEWAAWQQELVATARERIREREVEIARLRDELEEQAGSRVRLFALPPEGGGERSAGTRRPRHLRVERQPVEGTRHYG